MCSEKKMLAAIWIFLTESADDDDRETSPRCQVVTQMG